MPEISRTSDEDAVKAYGQTLSNRGRWGAEDELGTLNLISPPKRIAAASLVKDGIAISLSRQIGPEATSEQLGEPFQHVMTASGEQYEPVEHYDGSPQISTDSIGVMSYHGFYYTHLDALSHIFWNGELYNGQSAKAVTSDGGATVASVDVASNGVVTRGVLVDIPRFRDVDWVEPGEGVRPDELDAALRHQGVALAEGDALLIRTGHARRRADLGPAPFQDGYAGLDATCLPWLHAHDVALLGCDSASDTGRSPYPFLPLPIHQIGIGVMGLWLLDNANFEELALACAERQRWEFFFSLAPLRVANGTGSPVNPLAVL